MIIELLETEGNLENENNIEGSQKSSKSEGDSEG